jgi:hypothetical protein
MINDDLGLDWSYDPNVTRSPGVRMLKFDDDRDKRVIFRHHAERNVQRSREEGRPIFDKKVLMQISWLGDDTQVIERPATEIDKRQYRTQWEQFCNRQEQVPEGTPVEHLFPANPEVSANLRGIGIHIVEQLARLSPHAIDNIRGAQEWVNKAKKYLEIAEKGVDYHRFEMSEESHKREVSALNAQIKMLSDQVNLLAQAQKMVAAPVSGMQPMMSEFPQSPQKIAPLPPLNEWESPVPGLLLDEDPKPTKPRGWPKGKPRRSAQGEPDDSVEFKED